MKSLETVLQEANTSYDELMKLHPDIFSERGRTEYCFGWLQSEYKHLLEQINPAVTGLNDITTNKTQNYGN